jgi:ribosomal protein L21
MIMMMNMIEDEDGDSPYNNDGSLRYSKSQLAEFRAGAPAGGKFAIIELAGTQHKITVDDVIVSNRLKPVETYSLGSVHTFKDVLLVGSSHLTLVGMPTVSGAEVDVHGGGNYKRRKGHCIQEAKKEAFQA